MTTPQPRHPIRHALAAVAMLISPFAIPAGIAGTDCLFTNGFEDSTGCPQRWVSGYYVGYERGLQSPAQIDFSALTHLMVGRVRPLANGSVTTDFDIDTVQGPAWAHSAVAAAHGAGRSAILMVGGAGEITGWRAAATPANRPTFVANLLAAMDQFNADGLDLDWEPLEPQDYANFTALAQALRNQRPDMTLTVPLMWINSNLQWNPRPPGEPAFLAGIAPIFDQVNLMTYEMAAAYDGWHSWFASAVYGEAANTPSSVASSVAYYAASIPAHKLGIGMGFYGNCFRGVSAPRQLVTPGNWVISDGAMSFRNIQAHYAAAMTSHYDSVAQAPWLGSGTAGGVGPMGCNFVSYENPESITAKGQFVHDHGLGGGIIWTISQGYLPGAAQPNPLLDAIGNAF